MPSNQTQTSTIGNAAAKRAQLSAIRQRVGLESRDNMRPQAGMRSVAPNPPTSPADKPGAARQAMTAAPQAPAAVPAANPTRMAELARQFIQSYKPPPRPVAAGTAPAAPVATSPTTPATAPAPVAAAPAPAAYRPGREAVAPPQTVRPDPVQAQKARVKVAAEFLMSRMGRPPTQQEVALYLAKGPE